MALIMRRIASWIRRGWAMPGYCRSTMHEHLADQRQLAQIGDLEQPGAQAVVDVVVVVGDVVATAPRPAPPARHGRSSSRSWSRQYSTIAAGRSVEHAAVLEQRAVVLDRALERLPGEVEPVELGIALLELGQDAQRLGIVVEAAERLHRRVQRLLAGMAERRVAEIVGQRHRLAEILVEPQGRGRSCGRSAPPRANGSAACGSDRPRDRRRPASCASAAGTPSNG